MYTLYVRETILHLCIISSKKNLESCYRIEFVVLPRVKVLNYLIL